MPQYSDLDSNEFGKGLEKALSIRGEKNAPNSVEVSSIKYIADAVQAGFAISEVRSFNFTEAVTSGDDNLDVVLISPFSNLFSDDEDRDNSNHEIRILFFEMSLTGYSSSDSDSFLGQHRFRHIGNGVDTEVIGIEQDITKSPNMRWTLPSFTKEITGEHQFYQGNSWNGRLPAGVQWSFYIRRLDGGNFGSGRDIVCRVIYERVPKGARLPL